jgi:hypothetical protein
MAGRRQHWDNGQVKLRNFCSEVGIPASYTPEHNFPSSGFETVLRAEMQITQSLIRRGKYSPR